MPCKKSGIYRLLCNWWVLSTLAPPKINSMSINCAFRPWWGLLWIRIRDQFREYSSINTVYPCPAFFFFCTLYRTKKKTINLTLISNPRCLVPTSLQPDCSPERVDPIRNTAVPFWGQTAWNSTAVPSTKRGWILGIWVVCPHYSNLLWIWLVSPHNGTAVLCKGHSVRDQ